MAVRGRAVHMNNNLTLYITELSPINHLFMMVAYHGHILESTKGIKIKLGTYIDVNEMKYRRQELLSYLTFYLNCLSLFFHKRLFSLSCLGVQVVLDYKFCLL